MSLRFSVIELLICLVMTITCQAHPVTGHISKRAVAAAHAEFKNTINDGGMIGISSMIQNCYMRSFRNQEKMINKCILQDIAAKRLDNGMRQLFIAQGMNGVAATPFLSDRAFLKRIEIFTIPIFGSVAATHTYYGDAPDIVGD